MTIDEVAAARAGIDALYRALSNASLVVKVMDRHGQQDSIDAAFDHIEATILPCIGLALETLLDAAEYGRAAAGPSDLAELRNLGAQLEAFTRQIERESPGVADFSADERRTAA